MAVKGVSMGFLIVGVLLLLMKVTEFGPGAALSWWWVLLPFGLAVAWWAFADGTGLTQRRAMRKMDVRKEERRQRSLEQLGLGLRPGKGPAVQRPAPPPPPPASRPTEREAVRKETAPAESEDAQRRDPRL
jgi:small Trp-rich protein